MEQGSKIVNATQKQAKSISLKVRFALYNASNEQLVGITEVNNCDRNYNKTTIESSAIDENSRAGNDLLEQADSLNSFVEKLNSSCKE